MQEYLEHSNKINATLHKTIVQHDNIYVYMEKVCYAYHVQYFYGINKMEIWYVEDEDQSMELYGLTLEV
jgi:hypothetical protein